MKIGERIGTAALIDQDLLRRRTGRCLDQPRSGALESRALSYSSGQTIANFG